MKRVLILSVKAGAGHLRCAAALEAAFRTYRPTVDLKNLDALELTPLAFRRSFTRSYEQLIKHAPSLWGMLYERMERQPVTSKLKKLSELHARANAHGIRKLVGEFDPDEIICTHYLPAEVLAPRRRKGRLRGKLSIVFTDYDIHTMWIQEGADRYFVATDEMAHALLEKGIGDATVHVTGIPILPAFAARHPARRVLRRRLGIDEERATVLLAAGGFGMGRIDEAARALAVALPDAQILAIAGRNEELRRAVEEAAAAHSGRIVPFGYVENMHELMAASDIIVTKCGGLTSSESLAMGLPMVITRPIPGQEERNADFLLESGAAVKARSVAHLVYKVRRLLEDPKRLQRMRLAARNAARPDSARDVVRVLAGEAQRKG